MKIAFIGDHSAYHCGSAAVADALKAEIRRAGKLCETAAEAELVIVNGEGSMHHNSKGFQRKMAEVETALNAGKRVMLVNSVWQDNPPEKAELLRRCERVCVREIRSQRELAAQGIQSEVFIDQAFVRDIEPDAITDFAGSPVITDFYSREFAAFVRITSRRLAPYPYIDMTEMSWSSLVASLKTAPLLITGRHHAMYAACRARTPFVVLASNTHKIEGLFETAGVPIPVLADPTQLRAQIAWANANRALYDDLFGWMEAQPRWRLEI